MQFILVLLLAIAPLPHLPQFGATSEDDDVPTSLQYYIQCNLQPKASRCLLQTLPSAVVAS